jgi:hypothetical protein
MKSMKDIPTKRVIKWAAVVLVASCLFPPWLYTYDQNGAYGGHTRKPAGYYFIGLPPEPVEPNNARYGVKIDFGRLLIEWVALAAIVGAVWVFVVKPPWSGDEKEKRPQKFIPPPGNPEN